MQNQTVVNDKTPSAYAGDLDYEDREKLAKALASKVGIRQPETIVRPGEALITVGEENKRKLDAEIAALPPFAFAAQLFREKLRQEDAKDFKAVPIQRIGMFVDRDRPTLDVPQADAGLGYTDTGFSQLVSYLKPGSVRGGFKDTLLAISSPELRANVFNHFARKAVNTVKDDIVTVRTYVPNAKAGLRAIRAIVTAKHSLTTGDDLAIVGAMEGTMADVLAKAKMRVTRNERQTHFEVLWPAMQREIVVGDIVLIGVRVRNSETKQGSLVVEPFVLRTLCYNFTTAYSKGGEEEVVIRHVGDLTTRLPMVFAHCLRKVEPFVRAFGDAYKVVLPEAAPTRGEILTRVAKAFDLPEKLLTRAGELWDADGEKGAGDTLAGLVHAMTAASKEQVLEDAIVTERVAGQLVAEGFAALEA